MWNGAEVGGEIPNVLASIASVYTDNRQDSVIDGLGRAGGAK